MISGHPVWAARVLVIGAWGLAFSLAAHLTASHAERGSPPELADLLLGGSRQALSHNFFNEADMYFHKGVAHKETALPLPGPIQHWQTIITPEQHAHAEGDASAEILPWLKLAVQADPHNVEAFLVAAFWACSGLNRQDLAGEILNEAQRHNPTDYRIALEKGRLAIIGHHFDEAIPFLDTALILHSHTPATPERARELNLDQAEILVFLGFIHEARGDKTTAIECFKKSMAITPGRTSLGERLEFLEAGNPPPDSAQSLLERITRRSIHDTCKMESQKSGKAHDHSGGGEDDHDHHDHAELH